MKNVLMASSAIVGAAVLMASPAYADGLQVSAFQQFMASGGKSDQDSSDRGWAFSTNTEVHVNGSIMADNGVTFGFHVEFEADSGETNNVDENSITAAGNFGKLEFGNNDGAEDTFMVNGSNSGVDYGGVGNPTSNFLSTAFGGAERTSADFRGGVDTSDATKITYTTPNFSGFSAGVSFTPNTKDGTDGNAFFHDSHDGVQNNVGAGLGYDGEFNGVGVQIGVVGAVGKAQAEPKDTVYGLGGGLAVSFAGFTLASGAVYDNMHDNGGSGWAWDAGIGYAKGPWNFSVNGIISKDNDSGDKLYGSSANIDYNLAPGVGVFVTGYLGKEKFGDNTTSDNDIVAVTSGLKLSF